MKVNLHTGNIVSFKGLKSTREPCLFVFDLDGTLAEGSGVDIGNVCKLAKSRNATLVYATGRNLEKFQNLKDKCNAHGIDLPLPDFLIARNGLYVYKNHSGKLVEDTKWKEKICEGFDRKKILELAKEVALSNDFSLTNKCPENFSESKLCEFEFWGSDRMVQFVCSESAALTAEKRLKEKMKRAGVNVRVLRQVFHQDEWENLSTPEQLKICRPRYEILTPFLHQIDILPADKGDAVSYLKNRLNIQNSEILMAGNDRNDMSMLPLTLCGARFICPFNATSDLKNVCEILGSQNIYRSNEIGAKGVLDGIRHFIADV